MCVCCFPTCSNRRAFKGNNCWAFKGNNSYFLPRDPLFLLQGPERGCWAEGSSVWVSVLWGCCCGHRWQRWPKYQGKKHFFPKEKFVSIYVCHLKEVKYFGDLWEISYLLKDFMLPYSWTLLDKQHVRVRGELSKQTVGQCGWNPVLCHLPKNFKCWAANSSVKWG